MRRSSSLVEYEYDGEERLLVIGPDTSGAMLEFVEELRELGL